MARDLDVAPEDVPSTLMERLNTREAELLAAVAAEPSSPVLGPEVCVHSLKRLRFEREQAELQREIDRLQTSGNTGPDLTELLQKKLRVQRALEAIGRPKGVQ
jgi:hypothetical protein